MLKITIVVGNPKAQSRTRQFAEQFVKAAVADAQTDLQVIDLADHAQELMDWESATIAGLNRRVAESHIAVFASPTFKANFTGMLKMFLDRYPTRGLAGVVAVGLMTGGDRGHSMAPNVNLIPLLLELGAIVPMRGLFYDASQFEQIAAAVAADAAEFRDVLQRIAHAARELGAG